MYPSQMNNISLIVAIAENMAIGKDGNLLWHLPADMKHFKLMTTGHTVLMGRKTFESLPKGALPNRRNIVLTRTFASYPECETFQTIQKAIGSCSNDEQIFVIGGEQIYRQTINLADRLYVTLVHTNVPDADAFFPEISKEQWEEVGHEVFPADEKNPYPYSFINFIRKI